MALSKMSQLAACTVSGFVFGFVAEKANVHVPAVIISQMTFSQFTMLKVFLSAVATGLGIFSLFYILPNTRRYLDAVRSNFSGCVRTQTVLSAILGGGILGIGITLAGSCPGMIFVQVGTGTQNALFTLAGCFSGALLYALVDGYFFNRPSVHQTAAKQQQPTFVDEALGIPYPKLAVLLAAMLTAVVVATEYFVPWTSEVSFQIMQTAGSMLAQRTWSPILAGVIMGSLQLPISWAVTDTIGGSSSYCSLLAQLLKPTGLLETRPLRYLSSFHSGVGNWWQVVYVGGAVVGGAVSAYLSGSLGTIDGVSPVSAFIGGSFLVFGARLASGCTSGHGVSGMALLSATSFLSVAAMFGGAISLAVIMKYF